MAYGQTGPIARSIVTPLSNGGFILDLKTGIMLFNGETMIFNGMTMTFNYDPDA